MAWGTGAGEWYKDAETGRWLWRSEGKDREGAGRKGRGLSASTYKSATQAEIRRGLDKFKRGRRLKY